MEFLKVIGCDATPSALMHEQRPFNGFIRRKKFSQWSK
jgi:hypothetical protein